MWQLAQKKRQETGVKSEKIYNLEHENILSGILRCPVCGAAMYGNVNRKKRKDGTLYKDYQVLPQLIELWGLNVKTDVEAKKNFIQQSVK